MVLDVKIDQVIAEKIKVKHQSVFFETPGMLCQSSENKLLKILSKKHLSRLPHSMVNVMLKSTNMFSLAVSFFNECLKAYKMIK